MKIEDLKLKSEPTSEKILAEYCEAIMSIPTQKAKAFFREWNGKVPAALIRQTIFAGIFWAIAHPEDIEIMEAEQ